MKDTPLDRLPHSYPFRFLDKILELNAEKGAAIKNVSINEAFFNGHFKGNPIMPGVLIIEAMAQLAGLVMNYGKGENTSAYLAQVKDIRFKKTAAPGDQIRITAEINKSLPPLAGFSVTAFVGNEIAAEGELVMAVKGGDDL